MKDPKHHAVPVWYQKRFCCSDGRFYCWAKRDTRARWLKPQQQFYKRGSNLVRTVGGGVLADIEPLLADFDRRHAGVVDRAVVAATLAASGPAGFRPVPVDSADLREFAAVAFGRRLAILRNHERELARIVGASADVRALMQEKRIPVALEKLGAILATGELVLHVSNSYEFVFGDGVGARIRDGGEWPEYFVVPLAPRVAAGWALSGERARSSPMATRVPGHFVRNVNSSLSADSDVVGARIVDPIVALRAAYQRRRRVRPGESSSPLGH